MPDPISQFLSLLNVIFGSMICAIGLYDAHKVPSNVKWLKVMYAIVGVYWAVVNMAMLTIPNLTAGDYMTIEKVFVHPAFTLTLGLMASATLFRMRAGR